MNIKRLYKLYSDTFLVDTDTRKIRKDSIYFALKGENFNGNIFAEEALLKGASYSIIDEKKYKKSENYILVDDVLTTLQELAAYHRKKLNIPIIALTGSNGKTTTKELIHAVLSKQYNISATIGNLNNHIGVPLTLLAMTADTEIGIVEMGANHAKEIEFLCSIVHPDFGYITNFGKAHLEGFGSITGVIKAKSELYAFLKENHKTAFVNPVDSIQLEKSEGIKRVFFNTEKIRFLEVNPLVKISYNTKAIQSNLIGKYNYNNIAAAITIGEYFTVSDIKIKEALETYTPSNNRSQIIKKDSNTIILDAYNANPTSMKAALESFLLIASENKTVVLGDMFELGANSAEEHQNLINYTKSLQFNNSYFIGNLFSKISHSKNTFKSFEEFSEHFSSQKIKNGYILIKGSRGMALERVLTLID